MLHLLWVSSMTHSFIDGVLTITREEDNARVVYAYNPETQKAWHSEDEAVSYANSHPMYFILPPTLEELKLAKCKEIDTNTANAIVALAGDVHSQANKQAKSSQLIRKESLGTITDDEIKILNSLDGLFAQIETLIATGNTKEATIMACTTLAEFEAEVAKV